MKRKRHFGREFDNRISTLTEDDNCADKKYLSTIQSRPMIEQPSYWCKKSSTDEDQHFGDQSSISGDQSNLFSKVFGCGMCDGMFEIEKEFMEHCLRHLNESPLKDTFVELFEIHNYAK